MRFRMEYMNNKTKESDVHVQEAANFDSAVRAFRRRYSAECYDLVYAEEIQSSKPKNSILEAGWSEFTRRIDNGDYCEDDIEAIWDALHPDWAKHKEDGQ